MTKEQLEKVARRLCVLNNLDPDETVIDKHSHYDYCGYVKQWENWEPLVIQYLQVQQVIKETVGVDVQELTPTTKLIHDLMCHCIVSPKTQDMKAKELKGLLLTIFEQNDIDAALQYITSAQQSY